MSSRALRRLQKQQEEEKSARQAEEQAESEEDVIKIPVAEKGAFALLNEDVGGYDVEDDEEEGSVPVTKA